MRGMGMVAGLIVSGSLGLVLVGCSGGGGGVSTSPPTQLPTSVTVSTSSPPSSAVTSPAIAAPVLPAAASKLDAKGAEAFARYWFDVVNYTFATRDTSVFRGLALPSCRFCSDFAGKVDARKKRGETYVGGAFHLRIAASPGIDGSGSAAVDTLLSIDASKIKEAGGAVIASDPGAANYSVAMRLKPSAGRWRVDSVNVKG